MFCLTKRNKQYKIIIMFGSKKNKYCCDWFHTHHLQSKTHDSIRVVRLNLENPGHLETFYAVGDSGKRRGILHSNIPYRFFFYACKKSFRFEI
jgi:hypothetical protein